MKKRAILLFALALFWAAPLSAQEANVESLKAGDIISGQLRLVKKKHPNGTPIEAYQIVSDAPKPFAQKDEFCNGKPPKTFHLVITDNKAKTSRLKRNLGKKIEIVADDFMCSQTAWHIGDAVVPVWRFTGPEVR